MAASQSEKLQNTLCLLSLDKLVKHIQQFIDKLGKILGARCGASSLRCDIPVGQQSPNNSIDDALVTTIFITTECDHLIDNIEHIANADSVIRLHGELVPVQIQHIEH